MLNRSQRILVVALAASLLTAGAAGARGLVLDYETKNDAGEATGVMRVYLDGPKMRVEHAADGGVMIYDHAAQQMFILEDEEKRYTAMDEAAMAAIGGQVDAARAEFEEQLKSMPPEQREMVQKMMGDRLAMLNAEVPEISLKKSDQVESVQGKDCVRYDVMVGDVKQAEHWVAQFKDVDVERQDLAPMRGMAEFFGAMFSKLPQGLMSQARGTFEGLAEIDGFPVKMVSFNQGALRETMSFVEATRTEVAPELFTVPEGYTEQKLGR